MINPRWTSLSTLQNFAQSISHKDVRWVCYSTNKKYASLVGQLTSGDNSRELPLRLQDLGKIGPFLSRPIFIYRRSKFHERTEPNLLEWSQSFTTLDHHGLLFFSIPVWIQNTKTNLLKRNFRFFDLPLGVFNHPMRLAEVVVEGVSRLPEL